MLDFALLSVTSILFVVDPVGVVPAWLAMTQGNSSDERRSMARRAAIVASLTLVTFALGGGRLLAVFGVTLPAFQIAGGIVLFLVALDMMRALRPTQEGPGELREGTEKDDIAITPMAIPMLAGPASLTTVTLLMNQADSLAKQLVVLGTILGCGILVWLTLSWSERLHGVLGRTGIQVLTRLLGLVLLAISVQFTIDGMRQIDWSAD